ncbi:MAG: UvrD-helicase domain-containing protein [Planctomycetota bacterium]
MGFASCLEHIIDRYYESFHLSDRPTHLGPAPKRRDADDSRFLFGNPMERPRHIIREFWTYYHQQKPLTDIYPSGWEGHFRNVKEIHSILAPIGQIKEQQIDAWSVVKDVEGRLRTFFQNVQVYGPVSRSVFERVHNVSRDIEARCDIVSGELNQFDKTVRGMPINERDRAELRLAIHQLNGIREPLRRDIKEMGQYYKLLKEAKQLWDRFLQHFTVLAVQHRYRPALQNLDRFHLNEHQERFVALDHKGGYRIQGASGSGKTIILIHRALRLAREYPTKQVRLFTINRALASLFDSAMVAINGQVPPNLHVAAFYDFMLECVSLFEPREKYRLVDQCSGERIAFSSWRDFYRHSGRDAQKNIFAAKKARKLVRSIEAREGGKLDASRYLRDEMIYVQSAYPKGHRENYLSDHRRSRSIVFQQSQKDVCLRILQAWEEWLEFGHLCDIDGLTLQTMEHYENPTCLAQIRTALPTDFVLVDEVQDFSTLELMILRQLVPDAEGPNAIFLVGDINQKVYPKHHNSRRAGFNFQGKAGILKQNFRNTRQILRAAYNLPLAFPPREDEDEVEVTNPDLSTYEGGRPVVFECTPGTHLRRVLDIVKLRRGTRTAVVSENDQLLREIHHEAIALGFRCHELFRNEDLDLWKNQGDSLAADLVVSRLEAVKGFEFDTVIACDLSHGLVPRPGLPEDEHWREAAILYAALTRARDELVITYVGQPSRFLTAMLPDVELHKAIDETTLLQVLAIA